MSRVEGMVKLLTNEHYTPSQLFENFDEVAGKFEGITYRRDTGSLEFRSIHSGFIKNEPVFVGTYVIKNAENPRFLPNDKDFYLGFIKLIRNCGLPLDTLKRNLPDYAFRYTLDYYKADDNKRPKLDVLFNKFFSESSEFKDSRLTEEEKFNLARRFIYAMNLPKNADLHNGKPCIYTVDQKQFKNLYGYAMCVEINSTLNNLLALVGYDTLTISGTVGLDGESAGHCYNLMREHAEIPYSIIDCSMGVMETEPLIVDPYKGYDVDAKNIGDQKINYPMPSFEGATSSTPNIYAFPDGERRYKFRGL